MDWFTSDLHLDHANIIKYCFRPFNDKEEMNKTIIANWNNRVSALDTVWCLGDLVCTQERKGEAKFITKSLLDSLNGNIVLIVGDHDYCSLKYYPKRFKMIYDFYRFKASKSLEISLFHWPISRWAKSHYNSFHLYGHPHGSYQNQGKSFDIGVDPNAFTPLSLDEVVEKMKLRPDNEDKLIDKKQKKGILEQLSMRFSW